jgi:hypothetical protein
MAKQPMAGPVDHTPLIVGLALLGVGVAIALVSSSSASSAQTGASAGGGKLCPPTPSGSPVGTVLAYRLTDSGTGVAVSVLDDVRTELLIQPSQIATYDWNVSSSDPTVLAKTKTTTGPDPSSAHGTDRIDYWKPTGSGTATLTGQLVPKAGGVAISTFTLAVTVSCASSVGGSGPGLPPGTTALVAGQYYQIQITTASPIAPPVPASVQTALNGILGVGVVSVKSVSRVSPGNSPNSVGITILANSASALSTTQALSAAGLAPSPTGYNVVIASSTASVSPTYLAAVTDTPTVTSAQTDLANWLTGASGKSYIPTAIYPVTSVNGNPADPTWMATLALFQRWANAVGAGANMGSSFPPIIRADGVLDVATWTLIQGL